MIGLNKNAQYILDELIEQYVDYRCKDEYGISAFWYWFYQVKAYINTLDNKRKPVGDNLVYRMKYWGSIIYDKVIINNEIFVVVTNFKFNKTNFKKWINHESLSKVPYLYIGDGGYGYKIVQHEDTPKQTIMSPQNKLLLKPIFDDIIGFSHHFGYERNPTAIGFIGDRVYEIEMDGNIKLLKMSRNEFLEMKIQSESKRKTKPIISESIIMNVVAETLNKYIRSIRNRA